MPEQSGPSVPDLAARLRAYLDSLDLQTRRPGEPPLREAVAEQARQRLAEMGSLGYQVCPCGRYSQETQGLCECGRQR